MSNKKSKKKIQIVNLVLKSTGGLAGYTMQEQDEVEGRFYLDIPKDQFTACKRIMELHAALQAKLYELVLAQNEGQRLLDEMTGVKENETIQ